MKKKFFEYVSLNIIGMTGLSCYILADTFFVANGVGTDGLAALNLAISVYSIIHGTGLMLGVGGATRYAILKAQGRREDAGAVFAQAVGMGLAVSILFILTGIFASGQIALLLGANEATYRMTTTYLRTILCFSPFFIGNNILNAFVRNDGSPGLSMAGMLMGSFGNIVLDYVFIYPLGMGIFGAALATGASPLLGMSLPAVRFLRGKSGFSLKRKWIRQIRIFSPGRWWDICRLGMSALITELSSGIVLIVFNLLFVKMAGNTGVAAYGIIANLALVAVSVFTGISQGIQPLVSECYGRGDQEGRKKILCYAFGTVTFMALMIYLGSAWRADWLIEAFNKEKSPALHAYAKEGLFIYFSGFFFAGCNIVSAAFFSAGEEPGRAFAVSILRGAAAMIPMVLLLAWLFGITGIWCSFPAAEGVTFLVVLAGLRQMYKRRE